MSRTHGVSQHTHRHTCRSTPQTNKSQLRHASHDNCLNKTMNTTTSVVMVTSISASTWISLFFYGSLPSLVLVHKSSGIVFLPVKMPFQSLNKQCRSTESTSLGCSVDITSRRYYLWFRGQMGHFDYSHM